jgi:Methyltransferase domain
LLSRVINFLSPARCRAVADQARPPGEERAKPAPDTVLLAGFTHTWSDDDGVGLLGWAFAQTDEPGRRSVSLRRASIAVGGVAVPIIDWLPRPDLRTTYPDCPIDCGFAVHIPRPAEHHIRLEADIGTDRIVRDLTVPRLSKVQPWTYGTGRHDDGLTIFNDFIEDVNRRELRVLEIGSRIVSPGSTSKRQFFPQARAYVGFDYYRDSNTDVAGDAHRLGDYFARGEFDAVFSLSVLEHLAMPWLVAAEINKVLALGGITCHSSHFAWPVHDAPSDLWRFSDQGLKMLFSPPLGFETCRAGLFSPARIHLDEIRPGQEMTALQAGFGGCAILSRKRADLDEQRFRWRVDIDEVLPAVSTYPRESGLEQV